MSRRTAAGMSLVEGEPHRGCFGCEVASGVRAVDGGVFPIGRHWTINADVDSHRPCLVLQTRRHLGSLTQLTEAESRELGAFMRSVPTAFATSVGAARSYVYYLNEVDPPHVHLHVVARYADEDKGPDLISRPTAHTWSREFAADVALRLGRRREDKIVLLTAAALRFAQNRLSPHVAFARLWAIGQRRRRWTSEERAPAYVLTWLAVLATLLATESDWRPHPALVGVAIAIVSVRYADLITFHLRTLVDPDAIAYAGYRRSLLLLMLNLLELSLVTGTYIAATGHAGVVTAWTSGFFLTTLTATAGGSPASNVLQVLGVVGSLLLLGIGVTTFVSLIAGEFVEQRREIP